MSPGFSESMRKLHEPCGARLVADVAHALLRAVSRLSRNPGLNPCFQKNCWNEVSAARDVPNRERSLLISTPALLFDTVCESSARTGRQEESEARLHEKVRTPRTDSTGNRQLTVQEVKLNTSLFRATPE